ncbi:bifunctional DNA-formamidopyrimidine glycosylase/DNA-(apurinic or apyrimidinic site) lyase [Gulosibacter sp. GYB002]|uniref:bifunctional DNA-formamidopyrimidine glycosylase/DNA-(apurinic or apyrimidinic site) lyase n=1 Tax=Gulosibacter sp. GYB002 TaxID=2994391 RepID=UPI002F96136E
MPELPEVEVVRRGLERFVTDATVTAVEVLDERALKRHRGDALDFVDGLEGQVLLAPQRRGKFLWLPLADADAPTRVLMTHLGMSGQLLIQPVGAPDERQLCIRLRLVTPAGDEHELRFVDQRRFGSLAIDSLAASGTPSQVAHIARDPLDPEFDAAATGARLRRGRRAIKAVLLDQSVVSGVGNIYADEALWAARLHWAQPANTVSARKAGELLREVRAVFERALAEGGTSFDSLYVNVNGESGYFSRSLHAYGRAGEPCDRCGRLLLRESFANRSSFRCPRCQRLR